MEVVVDLKDSNQMLIFQYFSKFIPKNGDRLSVILLERIGVIGLRGFSGRFGP